MNFLEAAEIAKKNPGSHFSRGESGLFVVYLKDGHVITSPDQLSPAATSTGGEAAHRIEELERLVPALSRGLEICNAEIRQLRLEVNSLKSAIAKIPASEWGRFEEEQARLDEERRAAERDRIINLARSGQLSHDQLMLVLDSATTLGITGHELEILQAAIARARPRGFSGESFVVYSTTDGQ